jgi:hypothetical protein
MAPILTKEYPRMVHLDDPPPAQVVRYQFATSLLEMLLAKSCIANQYAESALITCLKFYVNALFSFLFRNLILSTPYRWVPKTLLSQYGTYP